MFLSSSHEIAATMQNSKQKKTKQTTSSLREVLREASNGEDKYFLLRAKLCPNSVHSGKGDGYQL